MSVCVYGCGVRMSVDGGCGVGWPGLLEGVKCGFGVGRGSVFIG